MSVIGQEHPRVLVTGTIPDSMNQNIVIRHYLAEGFSDILGNDQVITLPIEVAPSRVLSWGPALTLVFGSHRHDICDYTQLRHACDQTGSILAFWNIDDPWEFDANVKLLWIADYIFSHDRWASEHFHRQNVFHLPLAASPTTHSPRISISESQMQRDVFFAGAGYLNRERIIKDLSKTLAKVNTEIFLNNLDVDELPFCRNQYIPNSQLTDYLVSSRLVLNIGRDFDLANTKYQLAPSTPGTRTFEAAMAGACQVIFADSLEVMDYFNVDSEILLFNNPDEFEGIVMDLVSNPEKRARIGTAARERCLKDHTYSNRARKILDCTGILKLKETPIREAR